MDTSIDIYKNDLLIQINKYRKNHGAKPLINDSKIDKIAQNFSITLSKKGELDYSYNQYKGQDLGESVYKATHYLTAAKLAKIFYDEKSDYNFKDKNPEPSNFTQMVWKSSESFGFGLKKDNKGNYYYVLNYYPTGNVDGQFKNNVLPEGTTYIETNNKKSSNENSNNNSNSYSNKYSSKEIKYNKKDSNSTANSYSNKYSSKEIKYNNNKDSIPKNMYFSDIDKSEKSTEKISKNMYFSDVSDNGKTKNTEGKITKNMYFSDANDPVATIEYVYEYKITETEKTREVDYEDTKFNKFNLEMLEEHNKYRKIHHVGALKLNKEICKIAQDYAELLANKLKDLCHSDNYYKDEPLGENLYYCYGVDATGKSVCNSWYNEGKRHNYNGDYRSGTGHFSQMIWKESKEVGFGMAKNKKGEIYAVGNYFPAGNILGFFQQNVFKP